jgi:hypothetical protein
MVAAGDGNRPGSGPMTMRLAWSCSWSAFASLPFTTDAWKCKGVATTGGGSSIGTNRDEEVADGWTRTYPWLTGATYGIMLGWTAAAVRRKKEMPGWKHQGTNQNPHEYGWCVDSTRLDSTAHPR